MKVQLNINNVIESGRLMPTAVNFDGTPVGLSHHRPAPVHPDGDVHVLIGAPVAFVEVVPLSGRRVRAISAA